MAAVLAARRSLRAGTKASPKTAMRSLQPLLDARGEAIIFHRHITPCVTKKASEFRGLRKVNRSPPDGRCTTLVSRPRPFSLSSDYHSCSTLPRTAWHTPSLTPSPIPPSLPTSLATRHHVLTARSLSLSSPLSSSYHIKHSPRGHYHPRRAVMYVPASDERKVRKTTSLRIDTIVFDIEDGVAMNQKEKARLSVSGAIKMCRHSDSQSAHSEHVVRVNGVESGLMHLDLAAVFQQGSHDQSHDHHGGSPDAIMLPKADSVEHIAELDLSLAYHRGPSLPPLPLFIIVESPTALINIEQICRFGTVETAHLRLSVVVFGSDDYLARIGGTKTEDASEVFYARQSLISKSKAFGLDVIDMVDTNFKNLAGLRQQAGAAARMGYTGKQVIHPDQVAVVQEAFSPSSATVDWARGLIKAFHQHQASGQGAFVYQGHMIDLPLLLQAENVVKLQDGIEPLELKLN